MKQHLDVGLLLLRLVLGGTFVFASWGKIADPAGFSDALARYHLLPEWSLGFVAACLPWLEALAGGLLLAGMMSVGAVLVLGALCGLFAGALGAALLRGLDVGCGCFSLEPGAARAGWWHVGLDLALLLMAAILLWQGPGRWALDAKERAGSELEDPLSLPRPEGEARLSSSGKNS